MVDPFNPHEKESSKAFAAFVAYRDMGTGRTIDKVYKQYTNSSKKAPVFWYEWSSKYDWVERARLYDAHLLNNDRLERERRRNEELDEYRDQLAKSSRAALVAGQRALRLVLEKLERMTVADIKTGQVPTFIRAANDTIEKAMDGWGAALAVDELMDALSNDDR